MGFQWPFRHLIAPRVPKAGSLRAGVQHSEVHYRAHWESRNQEKARLEHAIASVAPATSSKSPFHSSFHALTLLNGPTIPRRVSLIKAWSASSDW
jgi:hypothetical protein